MLTYIRKLLERVRDESGVVPSEYVVMVAVGVLIAITVVFMFLGQALTEAIQTIGSEINAWIEGQPPFNGT